MGKQGLLISLGLLAAGACLWWMAGGARPEKSVADPPARPPEVQREPIALLSEPVGPELPLDGDGANLPGEDSTTIVLPPLRLADMKPIAIETIEAVPRIGHPAIEVWVKDQSNKPAISLEVQLYRLTEQQADRVGGEGWSDEVRRSSILAAREPTNDMGMARFENLTVGWWFVCVAAEEFERDRLLFPSDRIGSTINIGPTVQSSSTLLTVYRKPEGPASYDYLLGTVVDEKGNPIEGAWVVAEGTEEHASEATRSVSDGSFALGPVGEGDRRVWAMGEYTKSGDFLDSERVSATPGEPVRLVMPPGFTLRGRVIGATSAVTLSVTQGSTGREMKTRDDGNFEIRALTPGLCSIQAFQDPDGFGELMDLDVERSTLSEEVQIALGRAATLRIHPLRAQGAVDLKLAQDNKLVRWIRDIRGSSDRIAVPPGPLKLMASDESGVQRVRDLLASAGEEYEVEIEFGED